MNAPNRTQWQIRCAFKGFCRQTLRNENIDAQRSGNRKQVYEVPFSDLTAREENQLCTYDAYFVDEEDENAFVVAGKSKL